MCRFLIGFALIHIASFSDFSSSSSSILLNETVDIKNELKQLADTIDQLNDKIVEKIPFVINKLNDIYDGHKYKSTHTNQHKMNNRDYKSVFKKKSSNDRIERIKSNSTTNTNFAIKHLCFRAGFDYFTKCYWNFLFPMSLLVKTYCENIKRSYINRCGIGYFPSPDPKKVKLDFCKQFVRNGTDSVLESTSTSTSSSSSLSLPNLKKNIDYHKMLCNFLTATYAVTCACIWNIPHYNKRPWSELSRKCVGLRKYYIESCMKRNIKKSDQFDLKTVVDITPNKMKTDYTKVKILILFFAVGAWLIILVIASIWDA